MQVLKQWLKRNFGNLVFRKQKAAGSRTALEHWLQQVKQKPPAKLSDASFDVFTYHGEDGILLYLLDQLGDVPTTFVDIGAGDCIKSNCANLAVHFNWNGTFIDMNGFQLAVGKKFYKDKIAKGADIEFIEAEITQENVNQLLEKYEGKAVGLVSIDIDGNDFWIWKAMEVIQPAIVVIEAKVEFGFRSIAVPYGILNHASRDKLYNGASVEAFKKLGLSKGYKLVGANKQGYNLFFVKQDSSLEAEKTEIILDDLGTVNSFYPDSFFAAHKFENI